MGIVVNARQGVSCACLRKRAYGVLCASLVWLATAGGAFSGVEIEGVHAPFAGSESVAGIRARGSWWHDKQRPPDDCNFGAGDDEDLGERCRPHELSTLIECLVPYQAVPGRAARC